MKDAWKYILGGLLVFILVFFGILLLVYPGYGGMMGGWGYTPLMGGFGMMSGFMMLFVFLLPLAVIALIVIGGVALLRRPTSVVPPPQIPVKSCPNCGKPIQADWKNCPHCGNPL